MRQADAIEGAVVDGVALGLGNDAAAAFGHDLRSHGRHDRAGHSAEVDYTQHLESLFIDLRGHGVQWTPDDVGHAMRWYRAGVPLSLAKRVVRARIDAFRHLHGASTPAPVELRHYERAVAAAMGGRMSRAAGLDGARRDPWLSRALAGGDGDIDHHGGDALADDAVDDGADDAVGPVALIARLAAEGEIVAAEAKDPAVARATRTAATALRKLATGDHSGADLCAGLEKARAKLRQGLLRGVGATLRAALEAEAAAAVDAHAGADAQRRQRERALEAALSATVGAYWPGPDGWRYLDAVPR